MAMVAHGQPLVHSRRPVALPKTTNSEHTTYTVTNVVDTVSKITEEAGQLLKDVPYVKVLAGIVLQIVRIREEVHMEKERSQELVDKILRKSKVVLDDLLQIAASPRRDELKDMKERMNEYISLLRDILNLLKRHTSKSTIDRIVNRISRLGELDKYNRLIDEFNINYLTGLLQSCFISGTSQPSAATNIVYYNPVLPPAPKLMIGRDKEKSDIIEILLHRSEACVAILGAGGMGKTTLALSILHDPLVINQYPSRYFVSCEALSSVAALVGEVANTLRIPPARRDEHLIDLILSSFPLNTVLCLDNLETIWDEKATRLGLEDFLSHLNGVPKLAMIITMRGTQHPSPSKISWSEPLVPPLKTLSCDSAKWIFQMICRQHVDEFVEKVLRDVDGIPLAITLISSLLHEGNENSRSLWARWEKTRTKVVENGGDDRLSNLDTSISLSVHGPRMQADPHALSILAMLSILPDGLPEAVIDELQSHLPGDISLHESLLTLRRVSLVNVDETNITHRLRILSPIRYFCQERLQTPYTLSSGLISFYATTMTKFPDFTNRAGHAIISSELHNMHVLFIQAHKLGGVDNLVHAFIEYTAWSLYIGTPTEEIILPTIKGITGPPGLLGNCHSILAEVYMRQERLDEAERSFKHAVELHRQAQDVLGEAYDIQRLGDVYLRRNKLDRAEESFKHAIELHQQVQSFLGEANDIQRLGDVFLRRDKPDRAEEFFKHALKLHQQALDVRGEACDSQRLGDVYLRQDNLDGAEKFFKHAVELYQPAQDILGEACSIQGLGDVYLRRHKPDEAKESYNLAIKLHRQAQSVVGEANDILGLGDLHLQQNKLDEAEQCFKHGVKLHRQAQDILGEAGKIQRLGVVHLQRDRLDEAEESFKHAMELHQQARSVIGEAFDLQMLGDVYLRRSNLYEAEKSLKHAIELHQQAQSVLGEARDFQQLGIVYLQQDKLDKAEDSLKHAVELHQQAQSVLGRAYSIHTLGGVYLQQNKLNEAEQSFKLAIELHQQAHDIIGEACDIQGLGVVYLRRDKLNEAEEFFGHALELHQQAHDILGEAHDIQGLGVVCLRRDKLNESEELFGHALELHRQAQDVLGHARDDQKLKRMYL